MSKKRKRNRTRTNANPKQVTGPDQSHSDEMAHHEAIGNEQQDHESEVSDADSAVDKAIPGIRQDDLSSAGDDHADDLDHHDEDNEDTSQPHWSEPEFPIMLGGKKGRVPRQDDDHHEPDPGDDPDASVPNDSRRAILLGGRKTGPRGRSARHWREGNSVLAFGEPMMWLTASGLIVCMSMIVLLLLYIVVQGLGTFWPVRLVQLTTTSGTRVLGEPTAQEAFRLDFATVNSLSGPAQEAGQKQLRQKLCLTVSNYGASDALVEQLTIRSRKYAEDVVAKLEEIPSPGAITAQEQAAMLTTVRNGLFPEEDIRFTAGTLIELVKRDPTGAELHAQWQFTAATEEEWLKTNNLATMIERLAKDSLLKRRLLFHRFIADTASQVLIETQRRLLRTGNFELTNEHYSWVYDFELADSGIAFPEWPLVVERLQWGRFYGTPVRLTIAGQTEAETPAKTLDSLNRYLGQVRAKWAEARALEREEFGEISRRQDEMRLQLRKVEMRYGIDSAEWREADRQSETERQALAKKSDESRERVKSMDEDCARYQLVLATAQGQEKSLSLHEIVRAYPANQLGFFGKAGVYLGRWWEFVADAPREANTEGGVLPAIFGTVAMTLMMTAFVVPFGVLAALYLREYAKSGWVVQLVRISVNNLAGVPSIVFGVFGLGFFCYIVGGGIDRIFFEERLPTPSFGTGGLLWSALTLALLTLPVVIVSTEEALAAVPNSLREGSYGCGASKWQTIHRIVLPHALPGLMTGVILAMARGAGEVAPLMLVGAVKVADELPVDGVFPFVHLERSFMHLGFHIYDLGFQTANSEAARPMVLTTALLLILVIATLNIAAIMLRSALRKRTSTGHF